MIGLAELVSESLARHGVDTRLDLRRLRWSKWFRCESSFSVLAVPDAAGVFALAEEVIAPGKLSVASGQRILAIYRFSESDDLGLTMGRLFLPGGQEHGRLASGHCFARYAIVEDTAQRKAAFTALQQWMASSAEAASGFGQTLALEAELGVESSNKEVQIDGAAPQAFGS
jgi:hypothetical protein